MSLPVRAAGLLGLLLSGCATTNARMMVPVSKPAEVDLSQYRTLAIAEMKGSDAAFAVGGLLEDRLLQGKRFQLVDRQRMQAVMNELHLASSDLADSKKAVQLGSLITAGALISGTVTERYQETPRQSWFSSRAGARHVHGWTEARLTLRATFRVTDVSTGKLLVVKEIEAERGTASFAGSPVVTPVLGAMLGSALDHDTFDPPPDRGRMETEAREEVVDRFVALLQPTEQMVAVDFETDPAIPQLEGGIGWARHGNWDRAQAAFSAAIQDAERNVNVPSKALAKAYLDAALSWEYGGDPEKAIPFLEKAYQLSSNPRMLAEMDAAKRLAAGRKRVAEQQGDAK